jgi:hypothetical protein
MNLKYWKRPVFLVSALSASLLLSLQGTRAGMAQTLNQAGFEKSFIDWQSPAKLHQLLGSVRGNLRVAASGIEFLGASHRTEQWAFQDVQTFRLTPHGLYIKTYQDRKRYLPGVEEYRFDLGDTVPPSIADELAMEVQRPSQNDVPFAASQGDGIPVHHRRIAGGTNGVLQFRDGGIDYVTSTAGDSRSWRWADLQTLSNPDPWHLLVFGYRDTYAFDLKEVMPQPLYYRLVDALGRHYAAGSANEIHPSDLKSLETHGPGAHK